MAGIRTTELPILEEAPTDSDVVYIVDVSENVSKQISIADLFSGVEEPGLNSDEVIALINEPRPVFRSGLSFVPKIKGRTR